MIAQFVSFQAIFKLIRAEHHLRTLNDNTLPNAHNKNNTIAFPQNTQTNHNTPHTPYGFAKSDHATQRNIS